jgi:hypothetical protein
MEQDQKEKVPEQAGEWDVGKAAAERWVATVPEQARAAIVSVLIVERLFRIRQAFPARRLAVRSAVSR